MGVSEFEIQTKSDDAYQSVGRNMVRLEGQRTTKNGWGSNLGGEINFVTGASLC